MGFNAETAVDPLEWDFTKYDAGRGVTPEPSSRDIDRFFRKQGALVSALQRVKGAMAKKEQDRNQTLKPDEVLAELDRWAAMSVEEAAMVLADELEELMPIDEMDKYTRQMAELVEEIAQRQPTADQIMKLPHRIRSEFFVWFTRELSNPESSAAGSNRLLGQLNGSSLFT